MLCTEALLDKPTDHHNNLSELQNSATSCFLCAAILRTMEAEPPLFNNNIAGAPGGITDFRVDDIRPRGQAANYISDLRPYGILTRSVSCHTGRFHEVVSEFLVKNKVDEHGSHALENFHLGHDSQPHDASELHPKASLDGLLSRAIWTPIVDKTQIEQSRLDLIRAWISECRKNHPMCRSTKSHGKPTRLVDVLPGSRSDIVRLVDVTEFHSAEEMTYTALSHCWGADSRYHFMTTTHNEASRRQVIDYAALPKTYQDAVSITRKLGIRYIWIDSLCIIQNDFTDWQTESSRMGAVFQGSYLTIAAASATDGRDGCYLDTLEPPTRVESQAEREPIYVRCPGSHASALHNSPLNSRAWVLQELVLSPRTIHFTSQQLYWQCRELYFSEDGVFQSEKFASIRAMSQRPLSSLTTDHEELDRIWWSWIRDYSSRQLTKPGDWLAATAGITQYFHDHTKWTPCLGLWRESLISGLCWHINSGRGRPTARQLPQIPSRTTVKNVPTWSWFTFLQTPIYELIGPDQQILSHHIKILHLDVMWQKLSLTSQLESTTLIIQGQVQTLELCPHIVPSETNPDAFGFIVDKIGDHNTWALAGQDQFSCARCYLDEEHQLPDSCSTFSAPCLLLCYGKEKDKEVVPGVGVMGILGIDPIHLGHFLILRQVNGMSTGTAQYERIGIGSFDVNLRKPDPFKYTPQSVLELV